MRQFIKSGKKISYFFTFIIIVLSAVFLSELFESLCIYDLDDLNSTYDAYPLLKEENGRYVCNFLSRVFCLYIPKLLHMHIQDAANTIGMAVFVFIIILTACTASSFVLIKEKSIAFFNILLIFGIFHFIHYQYIGDSLYSSLFTFQYGYVLATCFGLMFLYLLFNYFVNYKSNAEDESAPSESVKQFILPALIGFCAGNSVQIMVYVGTFSVVFFYLYTLIENKFNFEESRKILFNKKIIIPVGAFILGAALMVSCPGFWNEFSWRHADSVKQISGLFPLFIKHFIFVVFIKKQIYYDIIFGFIIAILIKDAVIKQNLKTTFRNIFAALFPIFAIWIYFFSLISLGDSFPDQNIKFWLYEPYYNLPYLMVLFSVFCFMFGYLLKGINDLRIKTAIVLFSFVMCYHVCAYHNYFFTTHFKFGEYRGERAQIRQEIYSCDKYILTQYNNDIVFLPDYCQKYNIPQSEYQLNRYFKAAYSIPFEKELVFIDSQDAYDMLQTMGETISDEELHKTRFSDLKKLIKE